MRIGHSYDVHKLTSGREFILGGIKINHPVGILGHSDADVLLHVITESLIGALGLGDLGTFFPDTDYQWKDVSSEKLLKIILEKLHEKNYEIVNIDTTVFLEKPRLLPYINEMRTNISKILKINIDQINIKSTTYEKKGFIGRGEGIAAEAVVLIKLKELNESS